MRRLTLISLFLFSAVLAPQVVIAWSLDTRNDTSKLTAPQFKDLLNEWSFLASAPPLGPDEAVPAWRPSCYAAYNIRLVRPVEAAWTSNPPLARNHQAALHLPFIIAGMGLPGDVQTSVFYGRAANLALQSVGFDVAYPFILPSLTTPGLWARISYSVPMGLPGATVHLPAASLYLANEFFRTPLGNNAPLSVRIRAGVHQNLVIVDNNRIEDAVGDIRPDIVFPAATLFTAGFGLTWKDWALNADVGYASSQTYIGGRNRTRAHWNQQYRLSWAWLE